MLSQQTAVGNKRQRFRMSDASREGQSEKRTVWSELQDWCNKIDGMDSRLRLIYQEYNFPMEVRHYFAEWIECQNWMSIEPESAQSREFGEHFLNELLAKVNAYGQKDFMIKMKMQEIKSKLKESFSANPAELITVMRNCLNRERLLIESCQASEEEQSEQDALAIKYTNVNEEITKSMENFKSFSHEIELKLQELKKGQEEFSVIYRDLTHDISECDEKIKNSQPNTNLEIIMKVREARVQQRNTGSTDIYRKREQLSKILEQFYEQHFKVVVKRVLQQIATYRKDQKLIITGLSSPPEGALDGLNKLCEDIGHYFIQLIQSISQTLNECTRLSYNKDPPRDALIKLQVEVNTLLKEYLERILGGAKLGLNLNLPKVTASLHSEKEGLVEALKKQVPPAGVCEIVNGRNVQMEYRRGTGHLVVTISNAQLRGVRRMEKVTRDERVTEQKYGMILYTKVNILNTEYHLKTLSLPVILTSQSSQEWAAKGTLIWDAAFSEDVRVPFVEREQVEWQEMAKVLDALFRQSTDCGLKKEQLHYIAQRTFCSTETDYSKQPLTKDKFLKEALPDTNFSIWKWLFACMNLIKVYLIKEWKEGLIEGFVSREQCDTMLMGKAVGTFILRFREKYIESNQCSSICSTLTPVAVIINNASGATKISHMSAKLTASTLHQTPLSKYLKSMEIRDPTQPNTVLPVFRYLHPNKEFDVAFKNFLPGPDDHESYYDPVEQKHELRPIDFRPVDVHNYQINSPQMFNPTSPNPSESSMSQISVSSPGPVVTHNMVLPIPNASHEVTVSNMENSFVATSNTMIDMQEPMLTDEQMQKLVMTLQNQNLSTQGIPDMLQHTIINPMDGQYQSSEVMMDVQPQHRQQQSQQQQQQQPSVIVQQIPQTMSPMLGSSPLDQSNGVIEMDDYSIPLSVLEVTINDEYSS